MEYENKNKEELINELKSALRRIDELHESENFYRMFAENPPGMVYRVFLRENFHMCFFNSMVKQMTGFTIEELTIGDVCSIKPLILPEDRAHIKSTIKQALIENQPFKVEYRIRHKNGTVRHFLGKGKPIRAADGKPIYIDGVIFDISERKQAEEALQLSEIRFRTLVEQSPFATMIYSVDGSIIQSNQAAADLWNVKPGEVEFLRKNYNILKDKQLETAGVLSYIKRGFEGEATVIPPIYYKPEEPPTSNVVAAAVGRWIQAYIYPVKDEEGDILEIVLVQEDITDRKKAEESLRKSEERYALAVVGGRIGVWDRNLETNEIYVSPNLKAMLGYKDHEIVNTIEDWRSLMHLEDAENVMVAVRAHIEGLTNTYNLEHRMIHKDGSVRWFLASGKAERDINGKPIRLIGTDTDITDRKRAEKALQQANEELSRVMASVSDYLWSAEIDEQDCLTYRYYSPVVEKITARPPEFYMAGHDRFLSIVHPDDRSKIEQAMTRAISDKEGHVSEEFRIILPDGTLRWLRDSIMSTVADDGHRRLNGVVTDITERKRVEDERKITIELLRLINSTQSINGLIKGLTLQLRKWLGCDTAGIRLKNGNNYPYYETKGFSEEFVLVENSFCTYDQQDKIIRNSKGKPVLECMCGNIIRGYFDPTKPFYTEQGSFWTNSTTKWLTRISKADKQTRFRNRCLHEGYESVVLIPLHIGKKKFGLLQVKDKRKGYFTAEQISFLERAANYISIALSHRRAREQLAEKEERFRTVANFTYNWEYWLAPEGHYIYVSPSCKRITGYCYVEFKENPKLLEKITHPDDRERIINHFEKDRECSKALSLDFRIITRNGEERWIGHICQPVYSNDGKFLGRRGSNRDITDRKQTEKELQEYAETQAVLLREINHRVKNNLSAIISLLHKEEDRAKEEGNSSILPVFRNLEQRILSLSTVHTLLSATDWRPVALTQLCKQIIEAVLHSVAISRDIKLNVTPSSVYVNTNQAHHLTLIFNELATNTFKHGLQDRDTIQIHVNIKEEDNNVLICYHDNGPGYPQEMLEQDFSKTNVGFDLIMGIVRKSLRGNMRLSNDNGATINIVFKNELSSE